MKTTDQSLLSIPAQTHVSLSLAPEAVSLGVYICICFVV